MDGYAWEEGLGDGQCSLMLVYYQAEVTVLYGIGAFVMSSVSRLYSAFAG